MSKRQKPSSQYDQKPRAEKVPTCTDLRILLNGWKSGIVEHGGMKFRVVDKMGKDKFLAVTVFSAPAGTPLRGFDKEEVFLTVKQVQADKFYSSLPEESSRRKKCEALWNYLHDAFVAAGLKVVEHKPARKSKSAERFDDTVFMDASPDVAAFKAAKHGKYSFENDGEPRAVFEVYADSYTPKGETEPRTSVVAKVIAIEKGHPLHGKVKVGTFVHHNKLAEMNGTPDFRGKYAGDAEMLWEHLTDIIVGHAANSAEVVPSAQDASKFKAPHLGQRHHAKRPPAQASA